MLFYPASGVSFDLHLRKSKETLLAGVMNDIHDHIVIFRNIVIHRVTFFPELATYFSRFKFHVTQEFCLFPHVNNFAIKTKNG